MPQESQGPRSSDSGFKLYEDYVNQLPVAYLLIIWQVFKQYRRFADEHELRENVDSLDRFLQPVEKALAILPDESRDRLSEGLQALVGGDVSIALILRHFIEKRLIWIGEVHINEYYGGKHVENKSEIKIGGSVADSALSSVAHARDVTRFEQTIDQSSHLDGEAKDRLKDAYKKIDMLDLCDADKSDVAHDVGSVATELEKPEPDGGRLQSLFKRVEAIAPTVADILRSIGRVAACL